MSQRTNEQWIAELQAAGAREEALADLRVILLKGLRYGLVDWVNTSGPEFEPLAEDFVQDTLLKILANLETFRGKSKFTTWAHKIAVRVALTELRRKRWKDRSLEEMISAENYTFAPSDQRPTPDTLTEQNDLLVQVMQIIETALSDKQRQAIMLVPIGGAPIQEAADEMGMKRNAFYKLLHDARLHLKKQLKIEGMTTSDILAVFEQ